MERGGDAGGARAVPLVRAGLPGGAPAGAEREAGVPPRAGSTYGW